MSLSIAAKHRLVTLGDSLTQGFQSFAIYNTRLSYPAMLAEKLGLSETQFRYPTYAPATAPPDYMGPALNLEYMARTAGETDCTERSPIEQLEMALKALRIAVEVHRYWDDPARVSALQLDNVSNGVDIMHNLAIAGFDIGDLTMRTANTDRATLDQWAEFTDLGPIAANGRALISLPVLKTAKRRDRFLSTVEAAQALGEEGGIETLIVFIGANNALGTVITMDLRQSGPGYDSLAHKTPYNLWRPQHFAAEFANLVKEIKKVNAQHVLFGTVPHVTTAPLAHGVNGRMASHPQFFNYYTYPWIAEERFNPDRDPRLTGDDAILIDSYIDSYNQTITSAVQQANREGVSWCTVDICRRMDGVAYRRYWDPDEPRLNDVRRARGISDAEDYATQLPAILQQVTAKGKLQPTQDDQVRPPDSRFFRSDKKNGRLEGGLVALDGVHPTTVGYGIIAQEFLNTMVAAGVEVEDPNIDFADLVVDDSLLSDPPICVNPDLKGLGWGEVGWDWINGFAKTLNRSKPHHWRP
jgi:lysophospholipase L1-like esterase